MKIQTPATSRPRSTGFPGRRRLARARLSPSSDAKAFELRPRSEARMAVISTHRFMVLP